MIESKYKTGDVVYFINQFYILSSWFGKNKIVEVYFNYKYWYSIKNEKENEPLKWIMEEDLYPNEYEMMKKKLLIDKEKEKRIEKIIKTREKMLDIDPYGEENWMDTNERKISYKKRLCPDFWENDKLKEKIRYKLMRIAKDFYDDMDIDVDLIDVYFTGSMANYNYNSASDIDVHLIVDYEKINSDIELVEMAVDGIRYMWNIRHNIIIHGHNVELYVQNIKAEHASSGVYSIMNDEWIKKPKYNRPTIDQIDVDNKYDARVSDINRFFKISRQDLTSEEAEEYYKAARQLKKKIMKARREGLHIIGEFSLENLVFKKLRKTGKFGKLINTIAKLYDKIYSQ
jgi:hypothetical protein